MKHDSGSMSSRAWLGVGHYREARPSAVCREMRHRGSATAPIDARMTTEPVFDCDLSVLVHRT